MLIHGEDTVLLHTVCSLIQAQYHFYLLVKRVSKHSLSKIKQVLVSSNKPVGETRYCERKQVN